MRAGDDERGVVGSGRALDAVEGREERLELELVLPGVGEGDVVGRERLPVLHFTPLRILKVQVRPSALLVQLLARPGRVSRYLSP